MIGLTISRYRSAGLRAVAGGLLLFIAASCSSDGVGPAPESALPADSLAAPGDTTPSDSVAAPPTDSTIPASPDSTVPPPVDSTGVTGGPVPTEDGSSALPGIAFGTFNMDNKYLSSVLTGALHGGTVDPSNILAILADGRAKKARFVIKLCRGRDTFVKNANGTFSFEKWKALIDRYRSVNLNPYIADGTIVGHYLIDEPGLAGRWGGKIIPQSTIEAMAKYSKQIWPGMTTFVRAAPTWLASAPMTYTYLDAGWAQYASGKGEVTKWIATEVATAKSKRLGLAVGLNVLDGGDGSSRIRGTISGRHSMSAAELRKYGTALLNQSYACTFFKWMHSTTYYGRSDIKTALAELSAKAKAHAKTSCKQ